MSNPIIYNMYTPTQYCSDTTSYNTYAADSAARWYMSQVDMTCNGWGGLYAFGEDMRWSQMLNIGAVADYSWNQVINGGNNIMSLNPWGQWGLNNNTTPTTPSTKKDDTPATEEEREAKEEYDQLKNLLKSFAEKVLKKSDDQGDKDLGDDILKAIKNSSKTTYREKCDELREFYDLVKGDLEEFINENVTIKPFGGSVRVDISYAQIGNKADADATRIAKGIRDQLAKAGDDNPNLNNCTNVDTTNVIAVIGCYNDTDNLAKALQDAYNRVKDDATQADTARGHIDHIVTALKDKATAIAEKMDPSTKEDIEAMVDALPGITSSSFVEKFNELYTMVRLSMAKLVDKELERKYGKIDSSFMHATTDAIDDIKKELNKVSGLSIDPEALAAGIKVKPGRSYTSARRTEESNRQLNEKDPEEKIEALTSGGANAILKQIAGAKCNDLQVFQELHGFNKRFFVLDDDGLFYEVEEQGGTYRLKDDAEGIQASDLRAAGQRVMARDAEWARIEPNLSKDDYPLKKVNSVSFKGIGDATTTKDMTYPILEAEINGEKHYYILNDDAKLEEVEESNGQYVKKSGVDPQTVDELRAAIRKAKTETNRQRRENLSNPIKTTSIDVLTDFAIGPKASRWRSHIDKFGRYLETSLKAYRDAWSEDTGYTRDEWRTACDALISYYKGVYASLATIDEGASGRGQITSKPGEEQDWWDRMWTETGRNEQSGKVKGATPIYYTVNGVEKTDTNSTSCFKINSDGDAVASFDDVRRGCGTSDTGLYIGCDRDSGWKGLSTIFTAFIGDGKNNDFYFYLDAAKVFEKFKSFLPQ